MKSFKKKNVCVQILKFLEVSKKKNVEVSKVLKFFKREGATFNVSKVFKEMQF